MQATGRGARACVCLRACVTHTRHHHHHSSSTNMLTRVTVVYFNSRCETGGCYRLSSVIRDLKAAACACMRVHESGRNRGRRRGGEERVRRTQAGLRSDARAASRRPPGLKRALVAVRGNCTQRGEGEGRRVGCVWSRATKNK